MRFSNLLYLPGALLLCMFINSTAAAPDEALLGKAHGYPYGTYKNWYYDEATRVGSFSNLDKILLNRTLERAQFPSMLRRAPVEPTLRYEFQGKSYSIDDFMQRQRITGLLILKDGEILVERYQYDRKPGDRFTSHSMVKSITSLAIGFALEDKSIGSLDDKASKYLPELAGYTYGDTSLRNLLRMSSGVKFTEDYGGQDDLARFAEIWGKRNLVEAIQTFDQRETEDGTRFHYASVQTCILGLVIRSATKKTLSDYMDEKLWKPMGAEEDATWSIDLQGNETAEGSFNAVLRDYGRLGTLLAYDGMLNGIQILPKSYLLEATDWHSQPQAFWPGKATGLFGYGYQFWIMPGEKRRFALIGVYGQMIYVDPGSKLVMVQTGVARNANIYNESMGLESYSLWSALESKNATIQPLATLTIPAGVNQLLGRLAAAWGSSNIDELMVQYHVNYKRDGKDRVALRSEFLEGAFSFIRSYEWKLTEFREEGNLAYVKAIVQTELGQIRVETQFIKNGDRWYVYGNQR